MNQKYFIVKIPALKYTAAKNKNYFWDSWRLEKPANLQLCTSCECVSTVGSWYLLTSVEPNVFFCCYNASASSLTYPDMLFGSEQLSRVVISQVTTTFQSACGLLLLYIPHPPWGLVFRVAFLLTMVGKTSYASYHRLPVKLKQVWPTKTFPFAELDDFYTIRVCWVSKSQKILPIRYQQPLEMIRESIYASRQRIFLYSLITIISTVQTKQRIKTK